MADGRRAALYSKPKAPALSNAGALACGAAGGRGPRGGSWLRRALLYLTLLLSSMVRPLLLLLLVLLMGGRAAGAAMANGSPADSTRDWPETWRRAPTDTARIKALLDLPVWYDASDSVRAQQYARYALRLARRIGARRQEAGAWQGLGTVYLNGHRNAAARQCFRRALALAEALHDVGRRARYTRVPGPHLGR